MKGTTTITAIGKNGIIEKRTCNYENRFEEINRVMELYQGTEDFVGIHTETILR